MNEVRKCPSCGESLEGRSPSAVYCSNRCRARGGKRRATAARLALVPDPPTVAEETSVEASVRSELASAGVLGTAQGSLAVALARRVDVANGDTGASVAAVAKVLLEVLEAARSRSTAAGGKLAELRRVRAAADKGNRARGA